VLKNFQDGKINGVFLHLEPKEQVLMKRFKLIHFMMILIKTQLFKKLLWILVMSLKNVGIVLDSEKNGGNKTKRRNFGLQPKDT
jgi:hypothetical protein